MAASTSMPSLTQLPGRFPLPMPSSASSASRVFGRGPEESPMPIGQNQSTVLAHHSISFGAPRPAIPVTQSAEYTAQRTPPRPPISRRVVSDPQHDRPRNRPIQSHGTPVRKPRRRLHKPVRAQGIESTAGPASSEPSPEVPFSPPMTVLQVHNDLRTNIRKELRPNEKKGVVYILSDPDRPHLLKIGSSCNVTQRVGSLMRVCDLDLLIVDISSECTNYARAEALAHKDLAHLCRLHQCNKCRKEHREWFEVSPGLATRTMKRWVDFVRQEKPYCASGKLRPLWEYLLTKRASCFPGDDTTDHKYRYDYWSTVLASPSYMDHCLYVCQKVLGSNLWSLVWKYSWQVFSVFSWLTTFLVTWNGLALFVFLSSVACVCISMSSRHHGPKRQVGAKIN